jgi:hypothetical protein
LLALPRGFFASAICVHESRWREFLDVLRSVHGLPIRSEIHASEFINGKPVNLPKHVRLAILRNTLDELAKLNFISFTNVIGSKGGNRWITLRLYQDGHYIRNPQKGIRQAKHQMRTPIPAYSTKMGLGVDNT